MKVKPGLPRKPQDVGDVRFIGTDNCQRELQTECGTSPRERSVPSDRIWSLSCWFLVLVWFSISSLCLFLPPFGKLICIFYTNVCWKVHDWLFCFRFYMALLLEDCLSLRRDTDGLWSSVETEILWGLLKVDQLHFAYGVATSRWGPGNDGLRGLYIWMLGPQLVEMFGKG